MSESLTRLWDRMGPLGALGLGCAALAIVLAGVFGWAVLGAALTPGARGAETTEAEEAERISRYEESIQERLAQLNGRSLFFTPPAPSEAEQQAAAEEPEEEPEEEAPRPRRYGGPDVIAVINDTVWFKNDRYVRVGQEESGVRVVSVDGSPWSVRLEWRGVEFDVEVFERTTGSFIQQPEEGS